MRVISSTIGERNHVVNSFGTRLRFRGSGGLMALLKCRLARLAIGASAPRPGGGVCCSGLMHRLFWPAILKCRWDLPVLTAL